jgi:regulator of replication initiation timing
MVYIRIYIQNKKNKTQDEQCIKNNNTNITILSTNGFHFCNLRALQPFLKIRGEKFSTKDEKYSVI